jgi:hypothetical protein
MNSYRGVLNDFITSQVIDFFARLKSTSSALLHFCLGRNVPIAVIGITSVGDAGNAADRVRSQRYRVEGLDGDFLCYLYGIIDLDPEVPHSAFDFRMSERELCGSQIPG